MSLIINRGPHVLTPQKPCAFAPERNCDSYDVMAWKIACTRMGEWIDKLAKPQDAQIVAYLKNLRTVAEGQPWCVINCNQEIHAWVSLASLQYQYVHAWALRAGITVDMSDLGIPPIFPKIPDFPGTGSWFDRLEGMGKMIVLGLGLIVAMQLIRRMPS